MASRGKTTQLNNMYVADFETCDADEDFRLDTTTGGMIKYQRVWLAGFKNLETMKSTYFTNLDDFMQAILSRGDNTNSEYAFHNLKYDGSYIVPWLFQNGYTVSHNKPAPRQFSILVDGRNAWYSITIQVTKRRKVLIWDSLKLFPSALEYLPDVYATPTQKVREAQDWYNEVRPLGYQPNERDLHYFENDLQVPAETLNAHINLYGLRFKKTQAGQAFYNFEQSFKAWKLRFPALTLEQDASIRDAYWGGISLATALHVGKDHYNVGVYDINSSYPDKASNFKLPYGQCLFEYGEGYHPNMSKFWVAEALVEFNLKENCLPCIPKKGIMEGTIVENILDLDEDDVVIEKWLDNSHGIVRLRFSNIDYMTIQESYYFKVWRWCWSMHWAWKVQKEVARFVYKNNNIKVKYSKLAKEVGKDHPNYAEYNTKRNRAKIDNNAFYGKFGEDIIKEGKTPYWEQGEDGKYDVSWKQDRKDETKEGKRKFLPVAIAITAWGRNQLVKMGNVLGEHLLYVDTDSIHYLKEGEYKIEQAIKDGILEVDAEKLGAWKHEGDFDKGRYLRAKCYMEGNRIDDKWHLEATVAGLPADKHTGAFSKKRSCLNWDNFKIGHVVSADQSNKLRTIRTPSGNKLLPTGFQIKERDALAG